MQVIFKLGDDHAGLQRICLHKHFEHIRYIHESCNIKAYFGMQLDPAGVLRRVMLCCMYYSGVCWHAADVVVLVCRVMQQRGICWQEVPGQCTGLM